jgi:hypothetical protein
MKKFSNNVDIETGIELLDRRPDFLPNRLCQISRASNWDRDNSVLPAD